MTKEEFKKLTEEGIVILDGATGSNLQKRGMPAGVCPELWIKDNPEVLMGLQTEFMEAGSRIVYSPTFTANRVKMAEYGLEDRLSEFVDVLVGVSKTAAERFTKEHPEASKVYVAGDISMTGRQLKPLGDMDFEELVDIYKEQAAALDRAGADLFVVETMMSVQETRAAVIACSEVSDKPVMATLTFEKSGKTFFGTDPLTALITLQSLGVSAFGINCSVGPGEMKGMISAIKPYAHVPIICKPNAGLPELNDKGETVYGLSPEDFGEEMKGIIEAGADILGGCCGTTPMHIRALSDAVSEKARPEKQDGFDGYALSSERDTFFFGLEDRFFIIGERINPTGKKKLQEELRTGRFDMVIDFAEEQERSGARVLDINVGMSGIDEKSLLLRAVEEVGSVTNLPLSIDTSHVDIMEAALRNYPGRALMNSVSYESKKCRPLFELASKYGAVCILLPLSDSGIPESLDEKKEIIRKLVEIAGEYGLGKRDLVVDGLVGTVGANRNAALDTLETIRFCHEELGLATVCGLSNISFGLPERIFVNSAFLTMAINSGLTMAIANPNQERIILSALTGDLLMGKREADNAYIEYINNNDFSETTVSEKKKGPKGGKAGEERGDDPVFEAVLKGRRSAAADIVREALNSGRTPDDILNDSLLPAINKVGDLFDEKKYFLPQLIAGGETMKNCIDVLQPLLKGGKAGDGPGPAIVIGTVKGDIHDIGKNLVVMMLKNHGFSVTDLGKDVSKEEFLETALRENAEIIAMSALMTTTMTEMKSVIDYARSKGYKGKFMIGGAVITDDYAKEIGAVYSSDAADAVRTAKEIINERS